MAKRKSDKPSPVVLSDQDKDYFVTMDEMMGRFILLNSKTGTSMIGAPFPYSERDKLYEKMVDEMQDSKYFSCPFLLDDMKTVAYIPSHVMMEMIILVEAITPVPVH